MEAAVADLPERQARARTELDAAAENLEARRREQADAERALAEATDDDGREDAERARDRAADHVAVARARTDRAAAAVDDLMREAERLPAEAARLSERAATLPGVEPPRAGSSLVDWASHAHAELFVTTRQLDARRDRVIREANEVATMLLGEPTY